MRKIKCLLNDKEERRIHRNLTSLFIFAFIFGVGSLAAFGVPTEVDEPDTDDIELTTEQPRPVAVEEVILPITEVVTPTPVVVDTSDTRGRYFDVPLSHDLQDWIRAICEENGVPMALVMAIIDQESDFRAHLISGTNDYGIMQINACNHEAMIEKFGITDFLDPYQNVQCGIYIIGTHLQKTEGAVELALMRYNCGATGARRLWDKGIYSTKYSRSVMELYERYKEEYNAK